MVGDKNNYSSDVALKPFERIVSMYMCISQSENIFLHDLTILSEILLDMASFLISSHIAMYTVHVRIPVVNRMKFKCSLTCEYPSHSTLELMHINCMCTHAPAAALDKTLLVLQLHT